MEGKFKNPLYVMFVAVLIIANCTFIFAQQDDRQKVLEKVRILQELMQEKTDAGQDVSQARTLDEKSRQAMMAGDEEKCLQLLEQAIVSLQGSVVKEAPAKQDFVKKTYVIFEPPAPVNLLQNTSFEKGGDEPEHWTKVSASDMVYNWDSTAAVTGKCSVSVEGKSKTACGMWQQRVSVKAGTVYVLSGYVKFKDILIRRDFAL